MFIVAIAKQKINLTRANQGLKNNVIKIWNM